MRPIMQQTYLLVGISDKSVDIDEMGVLAGEADSGVCTLPYHEN